MDNVNQQPASSRNAKGQAHPPRRSLLDSYGLFGLLRLGRDKLLTMLFQPSSRLVRRPVYIRGRRWIRLGKGFTSGPGLRLDAFPRSAQSEPVLLIGDNVQVNDYVHIAAVESVTIGDRVLIASKVFITDHNHGSYSGDTHDVPTVPPAKRALTTAPVRIEDDVWIGESAAILPGVTIGRGAVIGALAVVNRSVPPFSIAVGAPARVVRRFNFDTQSWEAV
jgi:lipopolysaccharide O-acetyltransferase